MAKRKTGADVDFEQLAKKCDFDLECVDRKVKSIAKRLPKTTGITYGRGRLYYRYNNWKRKLED